MERVLLSLRTEPNFGALSDSSTSFEAAKRHAARTGTDLAVPNGPGVGDICSTRLVEDYARRVGRPIRLLTAPID